MTPRVPAEIPWTFSLALHAFVLLLSAAARPPLGATPEDHDRDQRIQMILASIDGVAEREVAEEIATGEGSLDGDDRDEIVSRCGEEHGGSMGDPIARSAPRRYGVQGPADNPDPHLGRDPLWRDPAEYFPWQALGAVVTHGDGHAPVVRWGRDDVLGTDAFSARGNMWGEESGDALGSPGAGVGRREICETCGDEGRGRRRGLGHGGEAVGTESTLLAALALR